jgi:putative transport protein
MEWLGALLTRYPELAVYLALGLGYWIGGLRVGAFSLGGITGSLLAGIFIGWAFEVPVSGSAKSVVFLLFLFAIGYEVGPQFFRATRDAGWRFIALGTFVPVVGLLTAWLVAKQLGLDPGLSAGLLSGALTESPAMGTATEAIEALAIDPALRATYAAHVGVADALCYVVGAFGAILICGVIGPQLLGVDLRAAARELEAQYGIKRNALGVVPAWQPFEVRAYRLAAGTPIVGRTVAEAERMAPKARLFVQRLRRGDVLMPIAPDIVLVAGDVVAISGRRQVLVELLGTRAEEVDDRELLDIPVASYEVFVSKPRWAGRQLEELSQSDELHGVYLRKIARRGLEIPIGLKTSIERGDVLHLVGSLGAVERARADLGEIVNPTETTDFVALGLAIFIGAMIGAVLTFRWGHLQLGLGTSVGTLLAGVLVGHLRTVRPVFGRIPDGAIKLMQAFGLAGFVAMVGLGAGPHFVDAVRSSGLALVLGAMVVVSVPLLTGLWFGRKVLGMQPLMLLGGLTGAMTFAPALALIQEKSGSPIAVVGYSGAVPIAHVFLTLWGSVIVQLVT